MAPFFEHLVVGKELANDGQVWKVDLEETSFEADVQCWEWTSGVSQPK